jgi:flagellar hook protein FlgE
MSLITALYTGATGLEGNTTDLAVIGDNVANSSTIGFKGSRAAFADLMANSLIGDGANELGLGTRLQMIQKILTQGALTTTGLATDLAIEGNGLFVVKGSAAGQQGTFYTRAGQFTVSKDGMLVNLDGLRVQGYPADLAGVVSTASAGDLNIGSATSPPRPTGAITIRANLQSDATVPAAFDVADPNATSNFSTSVSAFDSLGQGHQVDVFFRKNGAGDWEWHALTDGGGLTGGVAGTAQEVAGGTAAFDAEGRLTAVTNGAAVFNPLGATNPQPLTFNFGTPFPGGSGLDGLTQFTAPSAASFLNQDGAASGELARVSINSKGLISGSFTNGETRALGQVALATFAAPDQLRRMGGSLFAAMPEAGVPNVGEPTTANRGSLVSGALEQSNVDLAGEFIRMIAAQRNFQANSKTITTADALLAELMTIKR